MIYNEDIVTLRYGKGLLKAAKHFRVNLTGCSRGPLQTIRNTSVKIGIVKRFKFL